MMLKAERIDEEALKKQAEISQCSARPAVGLHFGLVTEEWNMQDQKFWN